MISDAMMTPMTGAAEYFVCRKHREQGPLLPGGPVDPDELIIVSHLTPAAPDRPSGPVYLGHLLVEPRRHAPGLADAEARAVGWPCARPPGLSTCTPQ